MAGKGGLISRLSASLSRYFTGKELVGGDFNGNRYYRWQDKNAYGEAVEKRMVAFPARVKYDPTLVAPEWFRWLHKTRHDPPTPDELQQCAPARPPAGPRHDPPTPDELQQCAPARPHTGPRHNPPTPDELQQCAPARPHAGLGPWRAGLPPDGLGQWPAGAGEATSVPGGRGEEARARLKQRVAALDAAEAARRFQAESLGLHNEQAGPAPDMGRFVEQLTGRGYGQHGPAEQASAEPAAAAPAEPAAAAPAEAAPPAGAAEGGGTGGGEPGTDGGAAGGSYAPETWKPGG